jgi:hypothetical protein
MVGRAVCGRPSGTTGKHRATVVAPLAEKTSDVEDGVYKQIKINALAASRVAPFAIDDGNEKTRERTTPTTQTTIHYLSLGSVSVDAHHSMTPPPPHQLMPIISVSKMSVAPPGITPPAPLDP